MKVIEVDPYEINVDEMNERKENLNLVDLERSIQQDGIKQYPVVRKRNGDAEVPYSVVIGQRRVLASQGAGIDTIRVFVADWDDQEALKSSIIENIEAFREDVSIADRAKAMERYWLLMGGEGFPSDSKLSNEFGVPRQTMNNWLEPLRDQWEGTIVDPDYIEQNDAHDEHVVNLDDVGEATMRRIRSITEGGEAGEELVQKVAQGELTQRDIQEIKEEVEAGSDMDQVVKEVSKDAKSGDIQVRTEVTFTGSKASAIDTFAQDRGMSKQRVVRNAIEYYLESEGYL